jgi:hypothetical protein
MRNVSDKTCKENQNTHCVLSNYFSKIVPFMRKCGKILYSGAGHRLQYGACALHAGYLRLQIHTHAGCVTLIVFPLQQWVAQTRLYVTLYVHCLSCLNYSLFHFVIALLYPLLKHSHFYLFLKISTSCGLSLRVESGHQQHITAQKTVMLLFDSTYGRYTQERTDIVPRFHMTLHRKFLYNKTN